CCYGGLCELPWAMQFPFGSPPHREQVQTGKLFVHGIKLEQTQGQVTVKAVEAGSPAEKAGVRPGDVVRSINERKPSDVVDANNLLLAIGQADSPVSLETAQGGAKNWM